MSRVEVVVIGDAVLLVMWLVAALGMRVPEAYSIRTYTLPPIDMHEAKALEPRTYTRCPACVKRGWSPWKARRTSR